MTTAMVMDMFYGNENITVYSDKDDSIPVITSAWKLSRFVRQFPDIEITKIVVIKKGMLKLLIPETMIKKITG